MINSPGKIGCLTGSLALGLGLLLAPVSFAQEAPRNLVPSFEEKEKPDEKGAEFEQPQQRRLIPERPSLKSPVPGEGETEGSLVVEQLGALHSGSIGLIGDADGGFGARMWHGTPIKTAVRLLEIIQPASTSQPMKGLFRRLLLTGAALPAKDAYADRILDLRLEKLQEAGLIDDALSLASRMQERTLTAERRKSIAELNLLAGKTEDGCRMLQKNSGLENADPFWIKLDSFCLILKNEIDRAELSVALLEEQGVDDPGFFALFAKLAGDKTPVSIDTETRTPLHAAMMKAAELEVAVTDPLAAYEEQFANVTDENDALKKSQLLFDLWEDAFQEGHHYAVSKASLDPLMALAPADYGFDFNLEAVKVLLLHKRVNEAAQWERVIRRTASQGSNTERLQGRKNVSRLDAYMLLSGVNAIARWQSSSFGDWLRATEEEPDQGMKTTFLISMLDVFGYPVDSESWDALLFLPQDLEEATSNHAFESNLIRAASRQRVGETVALSLLALGENGPAEATVTTLTAVAAALKAIGLEEEARQLVLEAAIARKL